MKVLIDARSVNPRLHGIGRHILNLLLGLSYLESDLEFVVWYRNPLPLKVVERSGGPFRSRFQWVKSSGGVFGNVPFLEQMELAWVCKVHRADLFHDVAMTGLRTRGVPSIMTIHALEALHFGSNPSEIQRLKRDMGGARMLIAVSRTVANEIEANFHISMPKIRVISNAIDPWYSERATKDEIRAMRERFSCQKPYFLCVTAERPSKNSKLALEVAETSSEQLPEQWIFTLPGPRGKAEDHVRFFDVVEDVWLRPLYADCRAAIIPSLYEGFSLPPIEALGLGALPVVSDIAAHREVLGDILPNELFFDPTSGKALEAALTAARVGGDHLKTAVLDRFRVVSGQYSFKQSASKVHSTYKEVLS